MTAGKRIEVVEAARGFAAVYVMVSHVLLIGHASDWFHGANYVFRIFGYGYQAVLLFFFISGFSIQTSSRARDLESWNGRIYFGYLRWRRLYFPFLTAVAIAIAVAGIGKVWNLWNLERFHEIQAPAAKGLLPTLFFLTDLDVRGRWFGVLPTDPPLWSLSYEVIYYALYPLFWKIWKEYGIHRTLGVAGLFSLTAAVVGIAVPNHISNVLSLYWVWAFGAWLAELKSTGWRGLMGGNFYYLVLTVLFMSANVLEKLSLNVINDWLCAGLLAWVMLSYLCSVAHPKTPASRAFSLGCIIAISIGTLFIAWLAHIPGSLKLLELRAVIFCGFVAYWLLGHSQGGLPGLTRQILWPFRRFADISYGLYVIHYPILLFIAAFVWHCGWPIGLMVVLGPCIALAMAWIVERFLQPRVAAGLDSMLRRFLPA
jgi:peptidoglycan/LPS O-acetylase OafA/YrhL